MKVLLSLQQSLNFILLGTLAITFAPAMAQSDKQAMEAVQRAREMTQKHGNHAKHKAPVDESQKFRGVYYGYLPCKHCAGIKTTLSLKNKRNYLIVTQYAQASTKEFYEKGKYDWDEKTRTVTLISRKDASVQKYSIINDATLIPFTSEGKPRKKDKDDYTLLRGDAMNAREVHIH